MLRTLPSTDRRIRILAPKGNRLLVNIFVSSIVIVSASTRGSYCNPSDLPCSGVSCYSSRWRVRRGYISGKDMVSNLEVKLDDDAPLVRTRNRFADTFQEHENMGRGTDCGSSVH